MCRSIIRSYILEKKAWLVHKKKENTYIEDIVVMRKLLIIFHSWRVLFVYSYIFYLKYVLLILEEEKNWPKYCWFLSSYFRKSNICAVSSLDRRSVKMSSFLCPLLRPQGLRGSERLEATCEQPRLVSRWWKVSFVALHKKF